MSFKRLVLFAALVLTPAAARADIIFFTDPAAYQAALAQGGMTANAVRFNEPGLRQTGMFVDGRVAGTTPTGPADLLVTISNFEGLTTLTSPEPMIVGNFHTIRLLVSSEMEIAGFRTLSGVITSAPGVGGTFSISVRPFDGFSSVGLFTLAPDTPTFFAFLVTDGPSVNIFTLRPGVNSGDPNVFNFSTLSDLNIGGAAHTPEPATMLLLGTGLGGAALAGRRKVLKSR